MEIKKIKTRAPLTKGDWFVLALTAAAAIFILNLSSTDNFMGFVFGSFIGFATMMAHRAKRMKLETFAAGTGKTNWICEVNGKKIGDISDAELARIELAGFNDRRTFIVQLLNLLKAFAISVGCFALIVPAVVFWFVIAGAVLYPADVIALVNEFQKAGPSGMSATVSYFKPFAVLLYFMLVSALFIAGIRFGYLNVYEKELSAALRQRFKVTGDGRVVRTIGVS